MRMDSRLERIEMRLTLLETRSLPTTRRRFIKTPIINLDEVVGYENLLENEDTYKELVSEH